MLQMAKLAIYTHLKSIKSSFAKLPAEAKTSYWFAAIVFLFVSAFVVWFFIPKDTGNLFVPGTGTILASNKSGVSIADKSVKIPDSLVDGITKSRKDIENNSNVVFARYEDLNEGVNQRRDKFLDGLRSIDIETPVPIVVNEAKQESEPVEPIDFSTDETVSVPYSGELFLGVVNTLSSENPDTYRNQIRALIKGQDVAKKWMNEINERSKAKKVDKTMGATVSFAPREVIENDSTLNANTNGDTKAKEEKYTGDDFLPGRIILARIDGYVESDTQTPFVRLKPVEGQADWVNDAIFLAQPILVEGQGFRIDVKKLTWKNKTGAFSAVVVSPDEKRSSIVVDEIDSREISRLAYLFFGGTLSGVNILASQLGGTVVSNNGNEVSTGVEVNKKNLVISAAGGIGSRTESYLMNKVSTTKDNHILHVNKLVGLMIIEKPDLDWLPSLNNNSVY
jgi:hypothetical protein